MGVLFYPPLYAGIAFWLIAIGFSQASWTSAPKKFLNPPPEQIERFHFGFADSMADGIWLRWIQDSDYCQTYLKPAQAVDTPPVAPAAGDLVNIPRHKICDTSWSFKMLDAVTRLAPRFKMAYVAGASMLAIVVEDYEGSSVLYDRGVAQYPNDWGLLYRAAFHFQFDVHDLPKAAALLNRAMDNGAPNWVASLASRLYSEAGQLEMAITTLQAYRETCGNNELALKVVDERIAELKARQAKSVK